MEPILKSERVSKGSLCTSDQGRRSGVTGQTVTKVKARKDRVATYSPNDESCYTDRNYQPPAGVSVRERVVAAVAVEIEVLCVITNRIPTHEPSQLAVIHPGTNAKGPKGAIVVVAGLPDPTKWIGRRSGYNDLVTPGVVNVRVGGVS